MNLLKFYNEQITSMILKIEELRSIEISQLGNMCIYCCMEMLLKSLGIQYDDIQVKYPQYTGNKNVQEILLAYVTDNFRVQANDRRICDLTDAIKKLHLGITVTREWRNSDQKKNGDFITLQQIEEYVRKYNLICVSLYEKPTDVLGHSYIIHQCDPLSRCFYVINPTDKENTSILYSDFETKWINKDVPYSELFFIHK